MAILSVSEYVVFLLLFVRERVWSTESIKCGFPRLPPTPSLCRCDSVFVDGVIVQSVNLVVVVHAM